MWPWEHAVVGYIAYSLVCHACFRESPGWRGAVVVAFASVLPDLLDKPLAWEFGVFETGYALGHSVLFAVPLALAAGLVGQARDRPRLGLAFALGYLLHLPADLAYTYATAGWISPWIVLWPVERVPLQESPPGLLDNTARLLEDYGAALLAGDLSTYAWVQVGLAVLAVSLWLYDGAPVVREAVSGGRRIANDVVAG